MSLCNRLFAMAGNTLHPTAQGFQCGHEPVHSSQSGTCVAIDATKDLWYCRSCHAGGGPVEAVMSVQGLSRTEATTIVQTMGGTISKRAGPKGDKESHLAAHLAAQYQDVLAYDGATQCWLAYGAQTLGIWSPLDTTAPDDSALARIQRDLELLRPEGFSWNFAAASSDCCV